MLYMMWFWFCFKPVVNPTSDDLKKDKEMREAFKKISGEDLEIDAYELQDILNAAFMKGKIFMATS